LLADETVDFHGKCGRERGAGGLNNDAVRGGQGAKFKQGGAELSDEIAADAAIEELADAGDGGGGCKLGVDG
jgi:hypothetical protein